MRWQAYRRVTHSTCSRVGMSPPLPGGRKWTWLRPPRQKWGLGQPFRGRREAPGTPSGLESPVEGRGGEDEGGGGGRIGGGEEGSWVGQLVRKEGWRKDIRLEEKPGRSSPPRVPPPLEALPPWTTLGIRGGEGTGRVRGMEGEEVGGVGGVGVGVGGVGGVRGVEVDVPGRPPPLWASPPVEALTPWAPLGIRGGEGAGRGRGTAVEPRSPQTPPRSALVVAWCWLLMLDMLRAEVVCPGRPSLQLW